MIIPLTKQYRLKSDRYCWMVQKSKQIKGRIEWHGVSYHATVPQAVEYLHGLLHRMDDRTLDMAQAVESACTAARRLRAAFPDSIWEEVETEQEALRERCRNA